MDITAIHSRGGKSSGHRCYCKIGYNCYTHGRLRTYIEGSHHVVLHRSRAISSRRQSRSDKTKHTASVRSSRRQYDKLCGYRDARSRWRRKNNNRSRPARREPHLREYKESRDSHGEHGSVLRLHQASARVGSKKPATATKYALGIQANQSKRIPCYWTLILVGDDQERWKKLGNCKYLLTRGVDL